VIRTSLRSLTREVEARLRLDRCVTLSSSFLVFALVFTSYFLGRPRPFCPATFASVIGFSLKSKRWLRQVSPHPASPFPRDRCRLRDPSRDPSLLDAPSPLRRKPITCYPTGPKSLPCRLPFALLQRYISSPCLPPFFFPLSKPSPSFLPGLLTFSSP